MQLPRGFTLIELLVVIAIIGVLASIVMVSLNGSRVKGRDVTRVASLKEMSKAIAIADSEPQKIITGCTVVGGNDASTCNGPAPINFASYLDPKVPGTLCVSNSQGPASFSACQYMIASLSNPSGAAPTTQNYEICTFMESPSIAGFSSATFIRVDSNLPGTIQQGCI